MFILLFITHKAYQPCRKLWQMLESNHSLCKCLVQLWKLIHSRKITATSVKNEFKPTCTYRDGESRFTLVRQIGQECGTTFNFQSLIILICSFNLLMIIGPAAAWSAWPVLSPLIYNNKTSFHMSMQHNCNILVHT